MRVLKLTAAWADGADAVEVKIEVYGLGRYDGKHGESNSITMPLEILKLISEKYVISMDELLRAYTKGVMSGLKEREDYLLMLDEKLIYMLGVPKK